MKKLAIIIGAVFLISGLVLGFTQSTSFAQGETEEPDGIEALG